MHCWPPGSLQPSQHYVFLACVESLDCGHNAPIVTGLLSRWHWLYEKGASPVNQKLTCRNVSNAMCIFSTIIWLNSVLWVDSDKTSETCIICIFAGKQKYFCLSNTIIDQYYAYMVTWPRTWTMTMILPFVHYFLCLLMYFNNMYKYVIYLPWPILQTIWLIIIRLTATLQIYIYNFKTYHLTQSLVIGLVLKHDGHSFLSNTQTKIYQSALRTDPSKRTFRLVLGSCLGENTR